MLRVLRLAAVLLALGFLPSDASAVAIAYEGYAYSPGALPPNNGGTGFTLIGWGGDNGVVVQAAPGLSKPLALPSSGAMIGGGFNSNRPLGAAISATTFWASFLTRSNPGNDQVFLGFDVGATSLPTIAFGRRLNTYFIQNGSNPAVSFGPASPIGDTDLLIARITRGGATTRVDLWVNKDPNGSAPDLTHIFGAVPAPTFVNTQVQPGIFFDEVRIGTTAGDVAAAGAGVPLPGWSLWLGGALLVLAAQRAVRGTARS